MENDNLDADTNGVKRSDLNVNSFSSSLFKNKNEMYKLIFTIYALAGAGLLLYYTAKLNPEIFQLHMETLAVITEAYNLVVLMLVPMFFGCVGALSRVLLSGLNAQSNSKLIFSSGLIATFSWLGIKSKVFLAMIAPYIEHSQIQSATEISSAVKSSGSEIYSLALVAVLVGMFASNIYIFIQQRVELLTTKPR